MLSSFNFPGKDTRLIRCGSSVYKITVQSSGDPKRFLEEHLSCDDVTLHKELNIAVDTVIAMTRRSKVHPFRTDHLVFMPIDSCQRYLQGETISSNSRTKRKKRPPAKNLFAEPAPKHFKASSRKLNPKLVVTTPVTTPVTRPVSSHISQSSVASRNSMPMFPSGLLHLIKEYAQTPKQDNSENFSPEKAKRILSDIATQLRPSSVQQPAANTPFSILQNRKRVAVKKTVSQLNSDRDSSTTESKTPPFMKPVRTGHQYGLRRRGYSSSVTSSEYSNAETSHSPSGRRDVAHLSLPAPVTTSPGIPVNSGYELPKTRSRTRQSSTERNHQEMPQQTGFFRRQVACDELANSCYLPDVMERTAIEMKTLVAVSRLGAEVKGMKVIMCGS
ncbi:hypothetical protein BSL78_00567 [Apostichopus japonicus]|uniref:Uncharacterized protein n=1 Tax=Stichopus japonicus TaxID=307972 RepID=A0A2G8LQL9_STIJA|nr:hypothetical protein BSL78_00567 [Apostichopus japonicus]